MTRRHVGIGLLVTALVLVVVALVMWQADSDQAEKDQLAEEYRAAIDGDAPEDIDASHSGSIALGAVAAVTFLGGVIVLVSPSSDS